MEIKQIVEPDGTVVILAASIPTEDVIVRSKAGYVPQYVTDIFGKTPRVTKDVTLLRLINISRKSFPEFELVSLGTPVNFDVAPTHLTRVEMHFKTPDQVEKCLKEIDTSDMMIRMRVQPAWDWQCILRHDNSVVLHVGWYDTVYFLQFKDIFLGDLHCRYSAKFGFDPREAKMTHFRYDAQGNLDVVDSLDEREQAADAIKDQVEFLRVFRDGTVEKT
ncbi:hypothetical protein A9404_12380 [Halothiobacillus diazotrophicus]|uniref:Uncharacterized protein n=1 Tax=Halothiobacillus diazotrophicus TaxID=1860122 RepID=A0A191ZJM2_9GAMM|nr:hypothetical protein [Halothiobacillus diazotrophicus]ANJ68065.1 hypothetical protein A9404_12380 [Halothiobacillus diazotrophicus]